MQGGVAFTITSCIGLCHGLISTRPRVSCPVNSGAMDIIRTVYYIHGPELMKLIFAVLYVS